jgi:hypothetical protein
LARKLGIELPIALLTVVIATNITAEAFKQVKEPEKPKVDMKAIKSQEEVRAGRFIGSDLAWFDLVWFDLV